MIRVVDPAQAQMMSGFVAWHVIGHQRRFATYQAQQREERWQRLGLRRAQDCRSAFWASARSAAGSPSILLCSAFRSGVEPNRKAAPQGVRGFHGAAGLDAMLGQTEFS